MLSLCASRLTVIQGALQDGRGTGPAVSDTGECENLDLIQNVFPKSGQLNTVAAVPFNHPKLKRRIRVLLFIHHLREREIRE